MDIARINAILTDCIGSIDDNHQPTEGSELFNFFVTSVVLETTKVHEHAAAMIELLNDWPDENYDGMVPPLGEEINYIVVGSVLNSQLRAFQLFAFGKIAGWWEILDPHTVLGMKYDNLFARGMVAMGMVAISGYKPAIPV